jgi:hypothetical protein
MNASVWSNDSDTTTNTARNILLEGMEFLVKNPSYYPYFASSVLAFLLGMIGIENNL